MLHVRVNKRPTEEVYTVQYREGWWPFIYMIDWDMYDYYENLPKALAVATELMNPTIINIEKEKS
ncbi:hypothetical protein UFOVP48_13 [uncultured Caudovirales phage]|uniref:Uncharacterized protein n=1 Tax=uncultured Caudovirales phage TaxID=2100421 RepID=A0A6J5KQD5_9CAUD|nr:hypothetical protein UFOVP48_13 [uncultured Caudovirales phage]